MHAEDRITYRTRSRIMLGVKVSYEAVHFVWQVYGNVIYYNQSLEEKVI